MLLKFFRDHVIGGGSLPKFNGFVSYLKDVYVTEKQTLKSLVVDKPIIVVFDEISDEEGRSVCIIIFAIPEKRDKISSYMAANYFERKTVDHAKVAQLLFRAVTEYNINPDYIIGFLFG